MNAILPDVSLSENAPHLRPLDWVGMQGIDSPLTIFETGSNREVQGKVDMQVDLPIPHVKGIHMSRLYRLLDKKIGSGETLSPRTILELLQEMIETHEDCGSRSSRLEISFNLLVRRQALITEGLAGWKSYPITIEATLVGGDFDLNICTRVEYSSTCPCSAALSRQLIEKGFLEDFAGENTVDVSAVSAWLREKATLATPHSQRSEARISVKLDNEDASDFGLVSLIDCVENAVGTPVQTAVKRADEQAFAALNGQNLMFVEDAVRRIEVALAGYKNPTVSVKHMESLHPHDAVASSGGVTP